MSENKCDKCGGNMVPGIPGDVYCPNDECFQNSFYEALTILKNNKERREREDYERLHEKFKTDRMDRG